MVGEVNWDLDIEEMEELQRGLEEVRSVLAVHGGSCDIVTLDLEGTLYLRLLGGCAGCPSSTMTLFHHIRPIFTALPYIQEVILHV